MDDDTVFRYGMGAVALTGAALGLVGAGLFADRLSRGAAPLEAVGYALGAAGGFLAAGLGLYHRRNPGKTTAALSGVPASASGVAIAFATTGSGRTVRAAAFAGVALVIAGCGFATYADASG